MPGAMTVFIHVCPVLKSFPTIGSFFCCASAIMRGNVDGEIGRPVRVRHIFHQRGVRVDHARRNRRIVRFERLFERLDRLMRGRFLHEDFGAAAPHHHHAIEAVVLLEVADVGAKLLGKIFLVLALLDVRAVEPLHVTLIEDRGPRLDGFELGFDLIEKRLLEHARGACRLIGVLFENIPAAENDVVEINERNRVFDLRRAPFGAFAEPDRAHLRQ